MVLMVLISLRLILGGRGLVGRGLRWPAVGAAAGAAAAVALAGVARRRGAAAGLAPGMWPPFEATHCANCAGGTTSTAIGMKPWRAPHSSEHWPK